MIRRRPAAGGRIPLLISYCRNFNTRPRTVSERMWRNHAREMYKNFSFIVTWRTKCGVIYKIGCDFLCSFASFHRERLGIAALFRHFSVGKSKPSQESIHVFVHYATNLSQSDNKTKDFVHSLRMNRPHSFRHAPQPSVKIFTIAVERGIRPPAAGLRRIIPGSAGHD